MDMIEKYRNTFKKAFSLDDDFDVESLQFNGIPEWDSVGHMDLVAEIEDAFDIMLETEEIIGLDSYAKGLEVLRAHDVSI
ncbi:MAG: acyl carrier protein [Eubacterium sp.]|nr:acyl carrier protein [Eubacterium sp.]